MAGKNLGSLVFDIQADIAGLRKDMQSAERTIKGSTDRMAKSAKAAAVALGAIGGALLASGVLSGIISTTREMEKLKTTLKTLEGSEQGAQSAFDFIADFASTTPFQLQEVTRAFIKLKSLGLDPSEQALRSYGNTASAMGLSLNQFIEAVADATTGEFERLKEFGIKASSEGDKVAFTFQGVTTEVKKSSEAIDSYLQNIGNTTFSGALENQANTLDGILSNIEDSFTRLSTADDGSLDELKESLKDVLGLLNDPQFVADISTATSAIVSGFAAATKAIVGTVNAIDTAGKRLGALVTGSQAGYSDEELKQNKAKIEKSISVIEANPSAARGNTGLDNLKSELTEINKILSLRASFSPLKDSASSTEASKPGQVIETGLDKLTESTKEAETAMKGFQAALDSAREAVNASGPKLTAENVQYSDLTRLTSEARIASVGGDKEKALELATEGAKAAQLLKESGKESGLVISGALKKLEEIAGRSTAPSKQDNGEPKVAKGELSIEIRGNTYQFTGNDDEMKNFVVKAVEDALTFEASAVGG